MLDVAQPTLSRQVRLLEQELGQHLLYRNGRGVEPTEAGLRFVEHARALLALAERAREDLRSLRETPAGKVSVGLPPRIARVLTPPLVQAFRREFPGASIAVAEGLSAQVREWLLAGRVDLALLYDPAPSPQLACESLFREDLVLAAAPGARPALPARVAVRTWARIRWCCPARPTPSAHWSTASAAPRACACRWRPRSTRCRPSSSWPRRAMPAPSCHAQPPGDRRPSTRWRWPISSPPHRQQPGAGDRPPPSSTRLASATAKLIRGLELRALFAPAKALKCPLRFLVWRLAAVKVLLASHLKQ